MAGALVRSLSIQARAIALLLAAALGFAGALVAAPASADDTFSISGQVSYASLPVTDWTRGVRVTVEGPVTTTVAVDIATGDYVVPDLPAGTYLVSAWTEEFEWLGTVYRPNLVPTFYSGSHVPESSWPVTVGPAGATGVDIEMPLGGSLEGQVFFGAGVPNAAGEGVEVTAIGPDGFATTTRADGSGVYRFWGLLPGAYSVEFAPTEHFDGAVTQPAPGFAPVKYRDVYSGAGWGFDVAANEETELLVQQLLKSTSISGNVAIEEGAHADWIRGVTVVAKARGRVLEREAAPDPATGNYTVTGLPPGAYDVEFRVSGYVDPVSGDPVTPAVGPELYDNVPITKPEEAFPVITDFGDVTGIDAVLTAPRSISGVIGIPDDAPQGWYSGISAQLFDETGTPVGYADIDPVTGAYSFEDLAPAFYALRVEVQSYFDADAGEVVTPDLVGEWYDDVDLDGQATPIDVTGVPAANVNVDLAHGLSISGSIETPAGMASSVWDSFQVTAYGNGIGKNAVIDEVTGTWTVDGLRPGSYWIENIAKPICDEDLVCTNAPVAGGFYDHVRRMDDATPVVLTDANATGIDLEYISTYDMSGVVTLGPGTQASWKGGLWVSVDDATSHHMVQADPVTGAWKVENLPPGEYTVQFSGDRFWDGGTWITPNLANEFWDDQPSRFTADTVTIAGADVTGIDATLDVGRSISGHVTLPVDAPTSWYNGVRVVARADGLSVFSRVDAGGNYTIGHLPHTAFTLEFVVEGFDDEETLSWVVPAVSGEFYNNSPTLEGATLVDVTDASVNGIDATLAAAFAITGTIALPGSADPQSYYGLRVSAIKGSTVVYGSINPFDGTYSIPTLAPGAYLVRVELQEYEGDGGVLVTPAILPEYYSGADEVADATSVTVSTANVSGIDFELRTGGIAFPGTGTPQILGTAKVGNVLTALAGTWSPLPSAYSYAWLRDGIAIPGATSSTYTVQEADGGADIAVTVTAKRSGYLDTSATSAVKAIPTLEFAAAPNPTITGPTALGGTLTANPGAWSPTPTAFVYEWLRNGVPIPGATGKTYLLTASDKDQVISVWLRGERAGYEPLERTSAGLTLPHWFTTTPTPTISGTLKAGYTLTAKPGTWSPSATLKYRWYRDGVAISGATTATYKLTTTDRGKNITVGVTGSKSGYAPVTKTSAAKYVPKVFTSSPTPTISGTARAGYTLTAKAGTWSPSATLTYQWYRGSTKITGATKSTYKLSSLDKGKQITVKVTGKKTGYLTTVKTSAAKTIAK